jgi:hypothetical protein
MTVFDDLEVFVTLIFGEWAERVGGWSEERFASEALPAIMLLFVEQGRMPTLLEAARRFGWGSPALLDQLGCE